MRTTIIRRVIAGIAISTALGCAAATAQNIGLVAPGHVIGNGTSTNPAAATDTPISPVVDQGICSTAGDVLLRGSSVWGCGTPPAGFYTTVSANKILAGPTTGSAAAPTFRALVGADLPTPGASSLGGVESYVAVSHQYLTSLSTGGALASAQPVIADISNWGTNVASAVGGTLNSSGGLVGYSGQLGTPTQGVLTNATGLPISTGLTGAGTGVLTAMGNAVNGTGGLLTYGIIGTAGATVPLLNGNNTYSGTANFTGGFSIGGTSVNTSVGTSQYAAVKIDGTTVTVNGSGQIQASAGSATNVAIGSTTVTSGTNPYCLYDNSGTLGNQNCAATPTSTTSGHIAEYGNSSGTSLTDAGTPAAVGASLVLLDTQTASGSSNIQFGSAYLSGTYKEYELRWDNVYASIGSDPLILQVSSNNCSTIQSSGYVVEGVEYYAGSSIAVNGGTTSEILLSAYEHGLSSTSSNTAAGRASFTINSGNIQQFVVDAGALDASSNAVRDMISGFYNSSGAINCIQISVPSSSIEAGNFYLYGLRYQ